MTDAEIIHLLGGVTAVARMLDIKPPSVHAWLESGIPEGRLRDLAGQIELKSAGCFTRRERWPGKYAFYWPELAEATAIQAQAAIEKIAISDDVTNQPSALRTGATRRQDTRRKQDPLINTDRCAKGSAVFQSNQTGVA